MAEDPWARIGLLADRDSLPPSFDPLLYDGVVHYLSSLDQFLPKSKQKIEFGITRSTGFRVSTLATGPETFISAIPIGLLGRLELLFRVLRREGNPARIQMVDPDYYGDAPDFIKAKHKALKRPEPFHSLGDPDLRGEKLWARLQELRAEFAPDMKGPENNEVERAECYENVMSAALFLALHEASHILREHSLVIPRFANAAEGRRGAEVDADYFGARNLALWGVKDEVGRGQPVRVRDLRIRANTSTYAVCGVLGLFDLDMLAVCDYESDDYRHPSARMSILGRGMCAGCEACLQGNVLIDVVTASGDGAQTYLARANSFWRKYPGTRRPTTIYVPLTPDAFPEDAVKKIPFMSSFDLTDVPTFKNVHQEAMKWLREFNSVRNELMKERAQKSIS